MPNTRKRPVTVALFAGGAVIGLAVAAVWGYRMRVDRPGHSTAQADRGSIAAAEKSRDSPPAVVWERTYGGARIDAARRILPWGKDGFFIDGEGKETGERLVGSPDFDWLTTMIATRDGGLVLTGSRSDKEITRSAGWVVRLDAKGDEL